LIIEMQIIRAIERLTSVETKLAHTKKGPIEMFRFMRRGFIDGGGPTVKRHRWADVEGHVLSR
jgi:hypothetical protein